MISSLIAASQTTAPDVTKPLMDALKHETYTHLIPWLIVILIGAGLLGVAKMKFERWLLATFRNRKQRKNATAYAGMSEDEIMDTPHCPDCNRMMKLRTAKKSGNQFWGCSAFPKCRGVREV